MKEKGEGGRGRKMIWIPPTETFRQAGQARRSSRPCHIHRQHPQFLAPQQVLSDVIQVETGRREPFPMIMMMMEMMMMMMEMMMMM
eukprot:760943-Hanusia_phi.AAC.1